MSHTVTVTRTTTSTTTSAIILNTGYCKTVPGLLKIAEVIIGLALFILINLYSEYFLYYRYQVNAYVYFLLVVFACLVGSACLLLACLFSLSTSSIIAKTLYEFIFHGVAFLLYLISLIYYFTNDHNRNSQHPYSTAAFIGLALFILIHIYSGDFRLYYSGQTHADLYYFLVVFACLVGSTCLFLACLFSLSTSSIIAKTLYEFVYHGVAFLLYLIALIFFFIKDNNRTSHHPYSTAGALGVVLTILYLISTIFAYRSYRGV